MAYHQTRVVDAAQEAAIAQAAALLLAGETVALPTETVYGLAGNALDSGAAAKIFAAKKRPSFDPLIVHVAEAGWIEPLVAADEPVREQVAALTARFWPGPLTIVVGRSAVVPDLVTAGLPAVALRAPAHPAFRRVLEATGVPLAAPSANRFGRVSPTTAAHVLEELAGEIPLILDGGPARIGLESTVVRPTGSRLEILRPGPVAVEALREFGEVSFSPGSPGRIEAPGQLQSHYAPSRPVILVDNRAEVARSARAALIAWGPVPEHEGFSFVASLSVGKNLDEAASRLFGLLREADRSGADAIYVERVPERGLGAAIMNRLRRAAAKRDR